MYTTSQKLRYIQSFLFREDRNGLCIFECSINDCLTEQDRIDLVENFENNLSDEWAFRYHNKIDLYFKSSSK